MQNIEQSRNKGKSRNKAFTNVCILCFDFSKKNIRCLSYKSCLTKTVHVDTRFSTDTDEMLHVIIGKCYALRLRIVTHCTGNI